MFIPKGLWLVLAAYPLRSEASPWTETQLEFDLVTDLSVSLGLAALGTSLVLLRPELAPASCIWCETGPTGVPAVNGFDLAARHAFRWDDIEMARSVGNWIGYLGVPLLGASVHLLGYANGVPLEQAAEDFVIAAEATLLAHALEQGIKYTTGRARPSVRFDPGGRALDVGDRSDNYTSFVSGHASVGFALAVSNGTIASMRGYSWALETWAAGLALASLSSYMRLASDRHYLTDVLAGAALGSLVGFLVPYVLHPPKTETKVRWSVAPWATEDVQGVAFSIRH